MYDLYEWKNGIVDEELEMQTIGELMLFSLGIFPSLSSAVESYSSHRSEIAYWNEGLFPLFESGGLIFFN